MTDHKSEIRISDCTLAVIKPDTENIMRKYTFQHFRCAINRSDSPIKTLTWESVFNWHEIDKYLCNGTLTIQIDAVLNFFTDPMETINAECKLPLDSVLTGMNTMLSDGLHSDLTIKCGGEEFKVHKAVLASQSPVFRRMLESDMKEQRTNVIEISDINQAVISDILAYIYTGSAPNLVTLARDLLYAANKYELSELLMMCEKELQLKMNAENVIGLLQMADMLNSPCLKKACLKYICFNCKAVRCSEEWKQFKENSEGHVSLLMEITDCLLKH